MIFAHMLVPHAHYVECGEVENQQSCSENISNVVTDLYQEYAHSHGEHSHCIITNIAYYENSAQPILADVSVIAVQYFRSMYSLVDLDVIDDFEYPKIRSKKTILEVFSKALSLRAPPVVA